jgi:NAD-dependent dihydropyrimidine dehydrogenase PreA subunit
MKGLFIPEITVEMFRNGCLESIEALMADGEIYDIEYDLKSAEQERKKGKWILKKVYEDECGNKQFKYFCSECGASAKEIKKLPSALPERKKGHWIDEETNYICSKCYRGCWVNSDYCPWCGADMRGE